jgi:hypothetical protein
MARKKLAEGEISKSQAIRNLLKGNRKIKASEAVAALGTKGIKITGSLFYIVKGKALGRKSRRKKREKKAVGVVEAATVSHGDAVTTILKVKTFAAEVGGLRALQKLVNALSE